MNAMGLDIGGANLKWARSNGSAGSEPFAVWQEPDALADRLVALGGGEVGGALLVTMTAELCDCFATRRAGVAHVLDAVAMLDRTAHVWSMREGFITLDAARRRPLDVAAGNWHALATWAARNHVTGRGVLIDVGSTTSDLIPLAAGRCAARGLSDTDRLAHGELVYLGAGRTPLMAIASHVTLHGRRVGVMAEHFATMRDAVAMREGSASDMVATRVLRMIGADLDTHTRADALALARAFVEAARDRLIEPLRQYGQVDAVLVSGSGEPLGEAAARAALPGATVRRLSDIIGTASSGAACAHALMELWQQPCREPIRSKTAVSRASRMSGGPRS